MKRTTLILIAATLLVTACRQPQPQPETLAPLSIHTLHGHSTFELTTRDTIPFVEGNYLDVDNEFTLHWPSLDSFPPATCRALIRMAFDDSTSPTLQEAGRRFLARTWVEDDDFIQELGITARRPIDSVLHYPYNSAVVNADMRQDSNLLHFSVHTEHTLAYAPHGSYASHSLIVDRTSGAIIQLHDLIDTTGIGRLLLRALDEVPANRQNGDPTECLSDVYRQCLPAPDGFSIDSTRSSITAFYNIYSVQCYGCGMLFVDMPVSWLAGQKVLTPYGKKVFRQAQ